MGDPVRAVLVGRREAIPASSAFGSVVLERAVDTLTLALIIFPAAAIAGAPDWLVPAPFAAAAAAAVVGVAQTRLPVRVLDAPGSGRPSGSSVARSGRAVRDRDEHDGRPRALVAAAGLSVVAWLLDGTIYWAAGGGRDRPALRRRDAGLRDHRARDRDPVGARLCRHVRAGGVDRRPGSRRAPGGGTCVRDPRPRPDGAAVGDRRRRIAGRIGARFEDLSADVTSAAPAAGASGTLEAGTR